MKKTYSLGPGVWIAAAFIGPGTITTCTIAGVRFGMALLWAMTLSIVATIVLQEMAVRIGIATQKGLAAVIKEQVPSAWLRRVSLILIIAGILIGNAAYEAGNITGSAMGLRGLLPQIPMPLAALLIGGTAGSLLFLGSYQALERTLIGLVLLMSLSFLTTAIIMGIDVVKFISSAFIPTFPDGSTLTIIALIGTTVVPYNLFLHASLVKEKWHSSSDLPFARRDTIISISLGGLISMAIIVVSSQQYGQDVRGIQDLAKGLAVLYQDWAGYFLSLGLFAAGLTSTMTAALAAAYVACQCFDWKGGWQDTRFRLVWLLILLIGVVFSSLELRPVQVIQFAQVANGILLPVTALFLLWVVNKKSVLGNDKNTILQNILACTVILISILLSLKTIYAIF